MNLGSFADFAPAPFVPRGFDGAVLAVIAAVVGFIVLGLQISRWMRKKKPASDPNLPENDRDTP